MSAINPNWASGRSSTQVNGGGGGIGTVVPSLLTITLEAGEALAYGEPVYVSANKLYKASNLASPNIVGIISGAAALGFLATVTLSGALPLAGITSGSPYYLGAGVIFSTAPL